MPIKSRNITRIICVAFVSGVFFVLGRYIYTNWDQLRQFEWRINYLELVFSLLLLSLAFIMLAFAWYIILRLLNCRIKPIQCMRIYVLSQLARYIPGKIFMFVARVFMVEKIGVSKTTSSISVLFEAILSTTGAFFAILITYTFSNRIRIEWISPFKIGVLLALGLIMLNPHIVRFILSRAYQIRYKQDMDIVLPGFQYYKIALICLYYVLSWSFVGLSFYFLVSSLIGNLVSMSFVFDLANIFLISWIVGFLSYIAPGGIGVREGVMTFSLQEMLPLYLVSAIAIISRVWFIVGELFAVFIVYLIPTQRAVDEVTE